MSATLELEATACPPWQGATGRSLQQMVAVAPPDPRQLALEIALKAAGPARRGEVVRYSIRHAGGAA